MPVWVSLKTDPIRAHWLAVVVIEDVLYGLVNMFGKTEGAAQALMREVLPIPVWYGLIVASAVLIAFGWSVWGAVLGTFAWLFLVLASVESIKNGTAPSYGGPILLSLPAALNFLIIFDVLSGLDAARERKQGS